MGSITLFSTTQAILLVSALSMDAFVASFAYGTDRIRIPFISNVVISFVCTCILSIALLFGSFINS